MITDTDNIAREIKQTGESNDLQYIDNLENPFGTGNNDKTNQLITAKRVLIKRGLCPDSVDRIKCFDRYMALWLDMVKYRQGKRNFFGPGKRSIDVGISGNPMNEPQWRNFAQNLHGESNGPLENDNDPIVQVLHLCDNSRNVKSCLKYALTTLIRVEAKEQKRPVQSKGAFFGNMESEIRKRGLCSHAADTLSCLDSMMGMYADMHSKSANEFVGK